MPNYKSSARKPRFSKRPKKSMYKHRNKALTKTVKRVEEFKINQCYLRGGIRQLFPDRMITKLRNVIPIIFTGVSGAVNAYSIMGNALHNPQSALISGAAPITWGSATTIQGLPYLLNADNGNGSYGVYNQYRIHSSAVRIKITNTSGVSNDGSNVIVFPADVSTITTMGNVSSQTFANTAEYPYAKNTQVSGMTVNKGVYLNHAISTARIFGLKYKSALESSQYSGVFGTNPTNTWAWCVYMFPETSSNTVIYLNLEIDYHIEFFDRNVYATGQG